MNFDDIIYLAVLFSCIGFGHFYKKIKGADQKKLIGTIFGVLVVFIVSGLHIFHTLLCWFICGLIITVVSPKKCHLVSFVFMFSYLFFFRTTSYFGIPVPPGHTNMIQMILTLKLVGLAFEKNNAYNKQKSIESSKIETQSTETPQQMTKVETEILKIDLVDIFHYSFNYVGVLTGPYFTYRTYRDYFQLPFSDRVDCIQATLSKMKWVPLFAGLFLTANHFWPIEYASETEFYEERSFLYRLMYVWPSFFIFRMRIYTGLTLSECVCTMAGLGAYPVSVESKPGNGPSKEYIHLSDEKSVEGTEYDFETIHNVDAYTTDTCWTFREAMRSWNMCVQYWMAVNIYKRFPNKKARTVVTLLISTVWHGIYSGYYFCMMLAPFYLPIEDLYNKLYRKEAVGLKRKILDVIFWISKFFAFSYMGIAFLLMTIDKIWHYYGSVYHFGYILWAVMYGVGVLLTKQKKKQSRKIADDGVPILKKVN